MINCVKCEGTGIVSQFGHIVGGTCFRCGGKGKVSASKRAPKAPPAATVIEIGGVYAYRSHGRRVRVSALAPYTNGNGFMVYGAVAMSDGTWAPTRLGPLSQFALDVKPVG